ncbi:MAG: helix-turn-helix transcriptional regulator [Clostridia bacterium]|nr:helix-turn-helix transcriptional regulator [Clostridia bacterium]
MDQIKIGKFIAERRKVVNLTQMQLAEKLGITDRAVSKWECGKSLPDSVIMIELCDLLKISVNELLCGEIADTDKNDKQLQENLLQMVKEKEQSDRLLLKLEIIIGVLSTILIILPTIIGALLPIESDWVRLLIVFSGFIPGFIGVMFALRIEQVAGYYECKECGYRYVPTFKAMNCSMHIGRTRKMKCPNCGKVSWQKKVISKK